MASEQSRVFRAVSWCAALVLSAVLGSGSLQAAAPVEASAAIAPTVAADPALEANLQELAHKLRCLVCQNQSIAESNAPLAVDLRNQVREQLAAGRSKEDVIDYLVARYGDFVLYEPPFKASTLLLWGGPVLLLLAGAGGLVLRLRRRAGESVAPLSQDERARAEALLAGRASTARPSSSSASRESRS